MSDILASVLPGYGNLIFVAISAVLCILLGLFAYSRKVLDLRASFLAMVIGFLIIGFSDFFWFILLLAFLAISYLVTLWKYGTKNLSGNSEGMNGERGVKNVVANGIIPFVIVLLSGPLEELSEGLAGFLFIVSISIATSDTFASEIGVIARNPRMITDPKRIVEPGVDGGVSLLGNIAAFLGALLISTIGYFLITDRLTTLGPHGLDASVLVIVMAVFIGWSGCQLDSLLGATLQKRGILTNNTVNFVTILIGVAVSIPLFFLFLG
ncbi:MAG: DUF92 domain-containing protein [Candidatus Thermoplasmatota archaeon]|nr:DUF92 domain-containing protein [Candidatus Thermoplasmatota archaeon]